MQDRAGEKLDQVVVSIEVGDDVKVLSARRSIGAASTVSTEH